jgi:YD repeat-containing protein
MPLFAFHLDVSAPPDVVEERVRAAVGKAPGSLERMKTSWSGPREPGFPLLGIVEGHGFRIQRAIRYRNSFLPVIRGKIVSTPTGSRVDVWMYMPPVSFTFMLIWFGFLAFIESKVVDSNIARSYAPLGMIVFGLVLSLGSFFYEVLKAMPLLSQAAFNPAIATVPDHAPDPRFQAAMAPAAAGRPEGRVIAMGVAAVVLVGAFAAPYLYEHRLRSSPAFVAVVDLASRSAAVKAALGDPVKAGPAARGMVHQVDESGYAILAIPLSGPSGKGTLYAVANRIETGWDIERAVLLRDAGSGTSERVDLSPLTQREPFTYPAIGRIYLLPLDDAAASDLKDLPAYYKALLDLDVTVLGTQSLGTDSMDAKAKQVIAEKALDTIEQTHREISEDLDSEILGVTSQDLNIRTSGWKFTTNYRYGRFGIVSTARLHGMPWYAGANPEIYGVRVRKIVTKNLALLHYPVELSTDATSAVATSTFTRADFDEMGERFGGERGGARSFGLDAPCVTIMQGPNGKQGWRLGCVQNPPEDNRFEMFVTYPGVPLFVMSRADFSFRGLPSFAFIRKYRPQDDRSRAFGIGATDSFDIFPVGDSQTFSWIELILADGERIRYQRTSLGAGVGNARLCTGNYMGNPFSRSSLIWNGNGWDLTTDDGWTYLFPSSGPDRTWQQGALIGIRSASGQTFAIQRSDAGDMRELRAPDGTSIAFTYDGMRRIVSAKQSSGRAVEYEYDSGGRLVRVHDAQNGDEFYAYDPANRLTSVMGARHQPLLVNTYGYLGEIRTQTLADGRKLLYENGYNESHKLDYLKLTLPNGYSIEWMLTRNGFTRSWPKAPTSVDTTQHR